MTTRPHLEAARRALTYHPVDDDGVRPARAPSRGGDGQHRIETCDKPICRETAALMASRGRFQVTPK